jgi:hypothetical protein
VADDANNSEADTGAGDATATSEATDAGASAPSKAKMPRWRRVLVAVLVVLGCIFAPLSILGVWVHGTLLDTDRYVSTVGPLADNHDVQVALANRITNAVTENTDVESTIKDALPPRVDFVAPYIASGLDQFVHAAALRVTQSSQFSTLWKEINRRAHSRIVALLQGKGTDTVETKDGKVAVQLGPIIAKVQTALDNKGVHIFDNVASSQSNREIVLIDSKNLRKAQGLVDLLDKLAWILPALTILFFAAAIWLSPNRRRTILRGSLGVALGMGLLLIVFNFGRHFYLDALPSSVNQGAAAAIYDQLLTFLRLALRTAFVVALIIAIAAWLMGPSKLATRIRTGTLALVHGHEADGEPSAVAVFFNRYRTLLRILVIAIGLIVLVAISAPTPVDVIVIAVLVLVGILLIEFLGRGATATADISDA